MSMAGSLTVFILPGVDWVQENVLGQGDQSNESALEQAKDEQISGMTILTVDRRKLHVANDEKHRLYSRQVQGDHWKGLSYC